MESARSVTMTLAEARLDAIESRLAMVEGRGSQDQELVQYQTEMLAKLRRVREAMSSAGGGGIDSSTLEERDALRKENEQLRKEIDRLKYRVNHLVKSLNDEELKTSAKPIDIEDVIERIFGPGCSGELATSVPLAQLIDILIDVWEADGLYD